MKINFRPSINTVKYKTLSNSRSYIGKGEKLTFGGLAKDTFEYLNPGTKNVLLFDELLKNGFIVRCVSPSVCAGETLANEDDRIFKLLSDSGIQTVIDLREYDKNYKEKCESNKLKYVSIPMTHVLNDKKDYIFDFKNNGINNRFVDDIALLLNYTKRGNVYLGCQYGVDRTNFALTLDYILNYKTDHRPSKIYPSNYTTRNALKNKNINLVKKIIKKLSQEQREKLGLDDDFESKILHKRIGDIIREYNTGVSEKTVNLIEKKTGYDIKL